MLIETVLVLPISSAICERGFSAVKRIKSDWRSKQRVDFWNNVIYSPVTKMGFDLYPFLL
jgi:hypothetical protein